MMANIEEIGLERRNLQKFILRLSPSKLRIRVLGVGGGYSRKWHLAKLGHKTWNRRFFRRDGGWNRN